MLVKPYTQAQLVNRMLDATQVDPKEITHLKKINMTSREASDLLMLGIGAYTPLDGFMRYCDWEGCCYHSLISSNDKFIFWPIPITLSVSQDEASCLVTNQKVCLCYENKPMGFMVVTDVYQPDKVKECKAVFKTQDPVHPGVRKVLKQKEYNIAGPVTVITEEPYVTDFPNVYQRPQEARDMFNSLFWSSIAALQLRNPMHNSHFYLAWIAMEICDGVYVHQILGNLKDDDIPAQIRTKAVEAAVEHYLRQERVRARGLPLEMRYAGPQEALLHAIVRQNYGCSHMIIGRDHAGAGGYYGPFDAQKAFSALPSKTLEIQMLPLDWTFYCYKCQSMASMKTCPHEEMAKIDDEGKYQGGARLMLSGTLLRKLLSENKPVPAEFSKPEVVEILREYYASKKTASLPQ